MSRQYDPKQEALKAYPDNREAGVDLFIGFMGCDQGELEYELGEGVESYIYESAVNTLTDK